MTNYEVVAGRHFWSTLQPLRAKYTREQMAEIILTIKACIRELQRYGHVEENGWDEHMLAHAPFADGNHFEFHVFDDDVLVVYFRRERNRRIRMVGVYDHATIPSE